MFPTIFFIPLISILLEYIKVLPFKKINNFKYSVMPIYNEPRILVEIEANIKIKVWDIVKLLIKSKIK